MVKWWGTNTDWLQTEVKVEDTPEQTEEENASQVAVDILETESEMIIVAPISGVELSDIDLSINKTVLTIKGQRENPEEYDVEGVQLRHEECIWWKFVRNIILPETLAFNKIKAYMQLNVLVITIPKLQFDTQTIKINKIER